MVLMRNDEVTVIEVPDGGFQLDPPLSPSIGGARLECFVLGALLMICLGTFCCICLFGLVYDVFGYVHFFSTCLFSTTFN